jgi:hypothetical protein
MGFLPRSPAPCSFPGGARHCPPRLWRRPRPQWRRRQQSWRVVGRIRGCWAAAREEASFLRPGSSFYPLVFLHA